jgi:hypothetical protein
MKLEHFVKKSNQGERGTSSMDPFDEFEFKPLTEGLGFHKKAVNLKEGLRTSGVLADEMRGIPMSMPLEDHPLENKRKVQSKKHTFDDVLSALEKTPLARPATTDLRFTEPLPRERGGEKREAMDIEFPIPVQSPFPQPEAYKIPGLKRAPRLEPEPPRANVNTNAGTRRGAADSPQRKLMPEVVSIPSALLDGIIVLALSIVFLIALLTVTKVDLGPVLNNLDRDRMTQLSLGILFIAVMQMYVIIARSFFGRTLGEWTFDLQLGEDREQQSESYPLKVAWRSLLNTVTGLILLPVISIVLGFDLAGRWSGVQLYRHRV